MNEIRYFEPLERAYRRMVEQLFRPFDLVKWLVLGFSCWLARLGEGGGWGGVQTPIGDWSGGDTEGAVLKGLQTASRLSASSRPGTSDAGWVGCFVLFLVVAMAALLALVWVSSRGHFLFVDNAVNGRARLVAPWKEYRREGNSLFSWQLGLVLVALVAMLVALAPAIVAGRAGAFDDPGPGAVIAGVSSGLLVLGGVIALAYVNFFLKGFVVPIMYRERLRTAAAWRVFLPCLREYPGKFVLVGLFYLVLYLVTIIAAWLAVLVICCVFLIVLALPYIGTVALLPLFLSYRLYTLEFLAQFSPRFDFFDVRDTVEVPVEPPPDGEPVG